MILKKLSEIQGNEILARPVMTWDYQVLLPEGATVRREYIDRISDLGIFEIYVKSDTDENITEIEILNKDIKNTVNNKVRRILERHTYQNNEELAQLSKTADSIITNILEEEKVVEKIFDIKERSTDIYEHSISICATAILTALKLNIDKEVIHDIGVGCLLHDIGLRYTTVDFKEKDLDSMNEREVIEYKKHPALGYASLNKESWLSSRSKYIILYHHERLDGSGFPMRIQDTPLECRIVAVCDAFDEMICGICQKQVKTYEAVEYMKNYRGIRYDGKVVDAFLDFVAVYPAGTMVLTNEGETAMVISQNKSFPDRPVLRIIKDKDGNDVVEKKIIDMIQVRHIFIHDVLD